MASDGKLYIIVTDQLPGGTVPLVPDQKKDKKDKDDLSSYVQHKFYDLIVSEAKQIAGFTINNIGNFTGNYLAQEQINNALQLLSLGTKLGMAAVAGSAFGPAGSLVAVGVVAVGEYTSQTFQLILGYNENTRQNRMIDQLRARAGLNGTNNDSRGTDQ